MSVIIGLNTIHKLSSSICAPKLYIDDINKQSVGCLLEITFIGCWHGCFICLVV